MKEPAFFSAIGLSFKIFENELLAVTFNLCKKFTFLLLQDLTYSLQIEKTFLLYQKYKV